MNECTHTQCSDFSPCAHCEEPCAQDPDAPIPYSAPEVLGELGGIAVTRELVDAARLVLDAWRRTHAPGARDDHQISIGMFIHTLAEQA